MRRLVKSFQRAQPLCNLCCLFSKLVNSALEGMLGARLQTARDNREEGEDYVKSAWPLWAGLDAYYNKDDKRISG